MKPQFFKTLIWYLFLLSVIAILTDLLLRSIPTLTFWYLLYLPEALLLSMFIYILFPALATVLMWPKFRKMYAYKEIPEPVDPIFFTLVIPAHNEAKVIRKLLGSIQRLNYPLDYFQCMVIADNCTDNTALIARSFNMEVHERSSETPSRKALALEFAAEKLKTHQKAKEGVLIIVDADCRLDAEFLKAMHFAYHGNPFLVAVQAFRYVSNQWNSDTAMLDSASEALRQWVISGTRHVWGMDNFALGLGFSFKMKYFDALLSYYPKTLAEDKAWKAYFGERNLRMGYAPDARLAYDAVDNLENFKKQRKRWVGSSWEVAKQFGFRMLWQGFTRPVFSQIDFGFSLFQQPRSFVLLWSIMIAAIAFFYPIASFLVWWVWILLPALLFLYGALGLKIIGAKPVKYLALLRGLPLVWNVMKQTISSWFKVDQNWGNSRTPGSDK